jgi:hypothetical protein
MLASATGIPNMTRAEHGTLQGRATLVIEPYAGQHVYYGDLHNHCAIGYGHGSVEEAFQNARLQLDFCCVTPHAWWPDIPVGEESLAAVVAYHQRGFQRAAEGWEHYQAQVEANHAPGQFVTLMGFEWHSLRYGDHHILFKDARGEIIRAASLEELRQALRRLAALGVEGLLVPHHIGYRQGYRGLNWETHTAEFSPLVEIMSMHGASESDASPVPYLHTMGPCDGGSTLQHGLAQGKIVGVLGSTDHHSAHPGSYGHGRVGLWAGSLTRAGLWEALWKRRTYALTGDRIALAFAVNDAPMGSVLAPVMERQVEIEVEGGDALDSVELLCNNEVIERWHPPLAAPLEGASTAEPCKIHVEVGWGDKGPIVDWQVALRVIDGQLLDVEPRFRGHEIVAPQEREEERYAFSQWERCGQDGVSFATRTWGNPTTTTASTQGMCLTIVGDARTALHATFLGKEEVVR